MHKQAIRVILINPILETVKELIIETTLQNYNATIGCDSFDIIFLPSLKRRNSFLYFDHVGRLKENFYFSIDGRTIPGNAIVVGGLDNSEIDSSTTITVEEVSKLVTWMGKKEAYYELD